MMADKGAWWSLQPFLNDEDANPKSDPVSKAKQEQVGKGTENAFAMAQRFKVNWAFGTDTLFAGPRGAERQGRQLAKLTRFMAPLEALHRATGAAGDLLALSGERAPYRGRLGRIESDALADLLVVDGDPATSLSWLEDPASNLRLIMKDGRIHKQSL